MWIVSVYSLRYVTLLNIMSLTYSFTISLFYFVSNLLTHYNVLLYIRSFIVVLVRMVTYHQEKMGSFMLCGRNRIITGVVLIAWIIVSIIYATKLEPTTAAEQFLAEDHPLQVGTTILGNEFSKTQQDATTKVHFVWGLEEINRDGVNQLFDPDFMGNPAFADDFIFNEECQSAILKVCDDITDPNKYENLKNFILLQDDGSASVDCFVEKLGAFNVLNGTAAQDGFDTCATVRDRSWKNESWQVSPDELASTMKEFVENCGNGPGSSGYEYDSILGWDGTSVRYAGISIESNVLDPNNVLPEDEVRIIYETFMDFAKELDKTVEDACGTKTIMTDLDQKFVFMNNQRVYRTSALSSSMIGVAFSFIVIFASTRRLHLSLFAALSILCVLVSVIGTTTMLGWTLGTTEAVLISILAGFSVDYVIHLAHAYNHAQGDVEERIRITYGNMGVSVFSGMLTSVIASIPLFFCTVTFFTRFGTFLCLTIVLSWIFANFGFMCLLATFKVPMDRKWI